jgi:hypothetical protein
LDFHLLEAHTGLSLQGRIEVKAKLPKDKGQTKGVAERGKCTNTHYFFFMDLADLPPSPSYYIGYVFPSSDVFLNVFLSYGPGFSKIL